MEKRSAQSLTANKPRFYYGYIIVIAGTIILMSIIGLYLSMGVFFKPMLSEFGWTRGITSASWAISNIVSGTFYIISSWLNDKFGPRKIAMFCGILAGAGYVLMSQIHNVWGLYFYYGVLIGASISILPPLLATVARWFIRRRTVMTGIIIGGGGLGGFMMPLISNWLISISDWRKAYVIMGIAIFIIVMIAAQFMKSDPAKIQTLPYGHDDSQNHAREKALAGLSRKQALGTRQFWMIIISFFCFGWSINVITLHIAPHVSDTGFSPAIAAGVLSAISGVSIIGRTGFASLGERIGNRNSFLVTYALMAFSLFWLIAIKDLWMLYSFAAIFGLAYGSGFTQGSPLTANIFGLKLHSFILGVMYFGQMVGAAIGTFLSGYLFDITGSYGWAWAICGFLSAIALLSMLVLRPIKTTNLKSQISNLKAANKI
jgi:MFS family permease